MSKTEDEKLRPERKMLPKTTVDETNNEHTGERGNQNECISEDNSGRDTDSFGGVHFELVHTMRILSEDKQPWIRHIEILSDGRMLLADRYNRQLYLYDKNGVYVKQTRLTSGPWNVTVTSKNMMAVPLPDSRAVVFVVIDSLLRSHKINVNDDCRGITSIDNKLVVNCVNNGLKIISMNGKTLKALPEYVGFMSLLKGPDNNLFCSLFAEDRIVCLDRKGQKLYEFRDQSLSGPCSLTTDSNYLFVIGHNGNNIHLFDERTKKNKVLLIKKGKIDRPWAIGYNSHTKTLFISNYGGRSVTLFQRVDVQK